MSVQIMGLEGTLAMMYCILAMIVASYVPGNDAGGVYESFSSTMHMLGSSVSLSIVTFFLLLGGLGTNLFGLRISSTPPLMPLFCAKFCATN